jgi:hypothetical protein
MRAVRARARFESWRGTRTPTAYLKGPGTMVTGQPLNDRSAYGTAPVPQADRQWAFMRRSIDRIKRCLTQIRWRESLR